MNLRSLFGFFSARLLYSPDSLPVVDFPLSHKAVLLYDGRENLNLKAGDPVKSGQRLAHGFYSPVTGKINSISEIAWLEEKILKSVEIETAADEWVRGSGDADFLKTSPDVLLGRLKDMGFDINRLHPAETVVVNCLDPDLLVCSAGQIIKDNQEKIKTGINLLKHLTGAKKAVIAVTEKDSVPAGSIVHGFADIVIIKPVYPNGAAEIVAGLAGDYSACVVGAEILCAMVDGITCGRPFAEKMLTLVDKSGKPVKNLRVRVGTPIAEIISAYNITLENNEKLIVGGPMKGSAIYMPDFPVTAGTDAVMIQPPQDVCRVEDNPCINCGRCVHACPRKIQINLLARFSEFELFENCEALDIDYCIECGMCSYVCTARRPLVQFVRFARHELKKLKQNNKQEEG